MWSYRNPVNVLFGAGSFAELPRLLGRRTYVLVTYGESIFGELAERLASVAGAPRLVIDDVAPNPDYGLLERQTGRFRDLVDSPDVIVALGGGSVIDSAKVFAAAQGDFSTVSHFLESRQGAERLGNMPIIAVPTTAGTGSEVTAWATVWDSRTGRKHSLSLPHLYPEHAVVDPLLMLGKPRALTVSTGLDALSHALESLWNVNANPVSANHAVLAAREILCVLPSLVQDLGNVELRTRMAKAALLAGLAFSNTKTAIAHSLSYPITLNYGVPHGIACSFSLPLVLRSVAGAGGLCEESLKAIFGEDLLDGAQHLHLWLTRLGVPTRPDQLGVNPGEWVRLIEDAFDGERGRNFLGSKEDLLGSATRDLALDAAGASPDGNRHNDHAPAGIAGTGAFSDCAESENAL